MRVWTLSLAAAVACGMGGCEDEAPTLVQNPDATPVDGSDVVEPLPLATGMRLTYQAVLTRRETGGGAEVEAQYRVVVEITDVEDGGEDAPSRVSFTMTDATTTTSPDWSLATDFDSWLGRLGPSVDSDQVTAAEVELTLDGRPTLPPAPVGGKTLPVASTFFVDIRDEDAIAAAWSDEMPGPDVDVEPDNLGLRLTSDGAAELQFFDVDRRRIELEYSMAGFLESASEDLGDPAGFPRLSARLNLVEGP